MVRMQARHAALPPSNHRADTTQHQARPLFPEARAVSGQLTRAGKHGRQTQRAGAAPCLGPGATTLAAPATQTHHPSAAASYIRQPLLPQVPWVKRGSASVGGRSGSPTGSGRKRAPEAGERERGEASQTALGGYIP